MAQAYSEEFHEFLETYGELLDQVENTRYELDTVQDEMSSRLSDLTGELEETMKLLQALEQQIWQFRNCTVVKEQMQALEEDPEPAKPAIPNVEDPFADLWKQ